MEQENAEQENIAVQGWREAPVLLCVPFSTEELVTISSLRMRMAEIGAVTMTGDDKQIDLVACMPTDEELTDRHGALLKMQDTVVTMCRILARGCREGSEKLNGIPAIVDGLYRIIFTDVKRDLGSIVIRGATEVDMAALSAVYSVAVEGSRDTMNFAVAHNYLKYILNNDTRGLEYGHTGDILLTAGCDGIVIGGIAVATTKNRRWCVMGIRLFIHPRMQGLGIAQRLIDALKTVIRQNDILWKPQEKGIKCAAIGEEPIEEGIRISYRC